MAGRQEQKEKLRAERLTAEQAEAAADRRRLLVGYLIAGLLSVAVIVGIVLVIVGGGDGDNGSSAKRSDGTPADAAAAGFDSRTGVDAGIPLDDRTGPEPGEPISLNLPNSTKDAGCELKLNLADEGSDHFDDENKDPGWETNPPSSGDHYGTQFEAASGAMADGAYAELPPLARAVHSLEHGRIEIQYAGSLPEDSQLELHGLFSSYSGADQISYMLMFPNDEMPYEVAVVGWRNMLVCDHYNGAKTIDALRNFIDTYRGPLGIAPEA